MTLFEAALAASLLWLHCSGQKIQSLAPGCILKELPFAFQCQLSNIQTSSVDEVRLLIDVDGRPVNIASCSMPDKYYQLTAFGAQYLSASRTRCFAQNPIRQNDLEVEFDFTLRKNWNAFLKVLESMYCGARLLRVFYDVNLIDTPLLERRRKVPICDVSINIKQMTNVTWLGAQQRITCSMNGNYYDPTNLNLIHLYVLCHREHCEYIGDENNNEPTVTFNATWFWNEAEVHCRLGLAPSSPVFARLKVKVIGVSLGLSQQNQISILKEEQRIDCRATGNYSAISSTHSLHWNVSCPATKCTFTVLGRPDGSSLIFTVSKAWKDAQVSCYLNDPPTIIYSNRILIIVRVGQPPVITPFGNVTLFDGQRFMIVCQAADKSFADVLSWDVKCETPGVIGRTQRCSYMARLDENGFGAPALVMNLTASRRSWNGATVTCVDKSTESWNSVHLIIEPLPEISLSAKAITTYSGMTATASCSAKQLWTSEQLFWSVKKCGSNTGTGNCTIVSDAPLANGVRQLKFVASRDWNGAALVCSASEPYRQQSQVVSVSVKPFPGLMLSPTDSNLTFAERQSVTLLCRASEHFTAASLLWSTTCKAGMCPASVQGEARGASASERFLSFTATSPWNGATVTCSVGQHPESTVFQTIYITGSAVLPNGTDDTDSKANLGNAHKTTLLVVAFCAGAGVVFMAAFMSKTFAIILCRLKLQLLGRPVGSSDENGDEAHSNNQADEA